MVQLPPPGPVEEAPPAPAFDPVLVREFFHFLIIGIQGEAPQTSKVTNFMETAALGIHYRSESGMLVFIPAVMPISDAIPMSKFLKKQVSGNAEWVVLNLDHLQLIADLSTTLLNLGKELKQVRKMLKDLKDQELMLMRGEEMEPEETFLLCGSLIEACDQVDLKIPATRDAALAVKQPELTRDALAVADMAEVAAATVRKAAVSEKILPPKYLHRTVKKAHRCLNIVLKATPVDLPEVNPFEV